MVVAVNPVTILNQLLRIYSWQRNPLKGLTEKTPSQKLGELISGLYILLVAKIVRKIHKRNISIRYSK